MTAQPIRVVLIEDHPLERLGIRDALERADDMSLVGEAATGAEGLRLARALKPDVVLSGIMLADGDGLGLLPELSASGSAVIILSCESDATHVRRAIVGGASGYLTKSEEPSEIVEAVRQVQRGQVPVSPEASSHLFAAAKARRRHEAVELTRREREVWLAVADGLSDAEIASSLFVAVPTVKTHVHNLLRKLGLRSRGEAIAAALEAEGHGQST